MTAATPATGELLSDEAIIELGRRSATRRLSHWRPTGLLTVGFAAAAVGLVFLPGQRPFSLEAVAVSLACYAIASRVAFEFPGGYAMPAQIVLVPMWFLVQPRLLPLLICAGVLLAWLPDVVRRRLAPDRLALLVVSSWHSLGPALVLLAWGAHAPSWPAAPICAAALAAQFAFDFASSYMQTRTAIAITPRSQLRAMAPSFAVDSLLAPLGLLVAFSAYAHPWALLLVLPMLALLAWFAKERQRRIDNAIELSAAYRGTAMLLGDVIEADDEYTGSHSRDVVELVLAVSDELGLDPRERRQAELAALLHDVGKVKIPAEIINKPGPLDDGERALINTHTIVGEEMLETVGGLLGEVGHVVRSCHERWDGVGYPDGLAGDAIPLAARIVCACDAWSAMTTDRSYRKALPFALALDELRTCAGSQFDPRVVAALAAVLDY